MGVSSFLVSCFIYPGVSPLRYKDKWSSNWFTLLIFLVHIKREKRDSWCSRCRKCSCAHFLVWGQEARSSQTSWGAYILLEHYSLCHLPTHCLPCQFPGSQLNSCQKCWTDGSVGLLISSPSGGRGHQWNAGGEEELLRPITVTAGTVSHLSCRTVTVCPGATCFKNQPHK